MHCTNFYPIFHNKILVWNYQQILDHQTNSGISTHCNQTSHKSSKLQALWQSSWLRKLKDRKKWAKFHISVKMAKSGTKPKTRLKRLYQTSSIF